MKNIIKKISSFISFHKKVIYELLYAYRLKTVVLLMLSIVLPFTSIIELKFLEFISNKVAYYDLSDDKAFQSVLIVVGGVILAQLSFLIIEWLFEIVNNKYEKDLISLKNKNFLRKISKISYDTFEEADFYNKIWLAKDGPKQYASAIQLITSLISALIHLIIYIVILCQVNIFFLFVLVVVFYSSIILSKKISKSTEKYYNNYIVPAQRRSSYFENIMSNRINHHTIQVGRQFQYFIDKYEDYANEERKYTLKMNLFSFTTQLGTAFLFLVTFFIVLLYIAKGAVEGIYTVGTFTLISSVLFRIYYLLRAFSQYILTDKRHMEVINTYKSILDLPNVSSDKPVSSGDYISVDNLSYQYKQSHKYALKNVSCKFKAGEKIAIVGENGSGKTTFISILLDLLQLSEGEYENVIGKVTAIMQDFQFYQLTIKENIELGRGGEEMALSEIEEILKEVDLYDTVEKLPDGVNTKLGQLDNGIELSKGQLQRLALAKMIADKDAKVWILDEPTAYLDPIAEIDMYQAILQLSGDRLVLFISHRLGFARKADRIIVISEGSIVESGSYDELISIDGGLFSEMYNAQKDWYYESNIYN